MELEGFPYLNLSFLDPLNYDRKEIRMNVPKTNVPLSGIIGADILPSVYKPGWSFTNPMVGNSVFGAFFLELYMGMMVFHSNLDHILSIVLYLVKKKVFN